MTERKCKKCLVDEPFSQCKDDPCTYLKPKVASSATKSSTRYTHGPSNTADNIEELINLEEDVVDKLFGEDRVETLNTLLSNGIGIDRLGINKERLINWACKNGYPDLVKLLLDNGANPNLHFISQNDVISHAISSDCTHVLDLLIEYGFKQHFNMASLIKYYLDEAIEAQKPRMVKLILHWGFDPKTSGYTLIKSGYWQTNVTIFKLMLSHGVTVESVFKPASPITLFFFFLRLRERYDEEEFKVFVALLEHEGAEKLDRHEYACTGCSLLHKAAVVEPYQYLEYLLKLGLDPNIRDKYRRQTPLYYAASYRNIQLLLSYGASAESADCNGNSPLHLAISNRCYEPVRSLLLFDVRSGAVNCRGKTAMDQALDNNDQESIEWLLLFGLRICDIINYKPDVLDNRKIRYKLARYAIKKRTAGMREDFDFIMDEMLCKFENRCLSELAKLKDLKILNSDDVNCLDLLRANKRALVGIASKWSEKDLTDFFDTCINGKSPIYEKMLWRNLYVGIRHAPVYNEAIDSFHCLIDFTLPSIVMEKLMSYFNVRQMENIIKSCQ